MKINKWKMSKEEVACNGTGITSTNRKNVNSTSRAIDSRSWKFVLIHTPTGMEVSGEIPEGSYSKKQMQQERDKLYSSLWTQLETKVAKHMKLPGL